ncbi:translation factor SUA5 [Propionicimonas paludicola]|uniref:L-threonylcarbamoyladenylate synthase n=1 Tax=Propionicimonas paludicola TaxID=185243 RepID=A0A2A9CTC4_9ACTN|nr:L-threonylcarbamoyladenylate synthase [Propionicimonas paludicola]PFG16819.1 translation factor SUA5 [Propionicimonas paludicola]
MSETLDIRTDPEAAIQAAVDAVRDGECIVLPTDTVYGIGADAFSADAVRGLLEAKGRGRDMPPPVLIADASVLRSLTDELADEVLAVADAFWPGPLTLILPLQPELGLDLGDLGDTIAVRVPDHDFTRELLRATGPLAVSSANTTGNPAAASIAEAIEQLGDSVAVYLDGGPASGPVPSTIVDLTGQPTILRAGRISAEALAQHLPGLTEG